MIQVSELQESPARFAFELEPNQEQRGDQGGPGLAEHGIPGSAVKSYQGQYGQYFRFQGGAGRAIFGRMRWSPPWKPMPWS